MKSLVTTDWLAQRIETANAPVILDASHHLPAADRDAEAEFRTGHIPGARYYDLASLTHKQSTVPGALPTREQLQARFRELGAGNGDPIVLYDDSDLRTAARAWFTLRLHGVADVAILDGGMAKWRAENRQIESGPAAAPSNGTVHLTTTGDIVADKAEVLANIDTSAAQLIDARDDGRFSGRVSDTVHNLPGGHIPGARNVPFGRLFDPDGTYRSPPEIRRIFIEAGVDPDLPAITTCGSGVTAAVLAIRAASDRQRSRLAL